MSVPGQGRLIGVGDFGTHRGQGSPVCFDENWSIRIEGEVDEPCDMTLSQLWSLPLSEWSEVDITCVSVNKVYRPVNEKPTFTGVFFSGLAQHVGIRLNSQGDPIAKTVRFISKAPGSCGPVDQLHETALDLAHCLTTSKVMLTGSMNGEPLPYANGGPVRTIVADRYFYKSIKWLGAIQFLSKPLEECRGTWESYAGYHNLARVAHEERFEPFFKVLDATGDLQGVDNPQHVFEEMLKNGDVSRLTCAKLDRLIPDLKQKLSGRGDLRLVDKDSLEIAAGFRGTNFGGFDFQGWDFSCVNFSLSQFIGANLSNAQLCGCDFEGATLWGADLRNADATGAFLGGVEFCKASGSMGAKVEGFNVTDARGLEPETIDWLRENGAIGITGEWGS